MMPDRARRKHRESTVSRPQVICKFVYFAILLVSLGHQGCKSGPAKEPSFHGVTLSERLRQLEDPDAAVRKEAAAELVHFREHADQIRPALLPLMQKDPDARVRYNAGSTLAKLVPTEDMIPALVELLSDPQAGVRFSAALGLGLMGPKAKATVPELIRALRTESDRTNKEMLVMALGRIGPAAAEALPLLRELAANDYDVRSDAEVAIARITGEPLR